MKILMFGRGVISTQYGWAFEKAGHSVEFYVRPGRKSELGEKVTLNIYDARKKIRGVLVDEDWKVTLREDLNSGYDLIIVSVQHYHFPDAVNFLADRIGNATVLIFNNLWEEPATAVAGLPASQVVWGFPQAGGGFDQKGVLNGALLGGVNMGMSAEKPTVRELQVMDLLSSSGFKIKLYTDFRSYLFSHFILNAALHFEGVKAGKGLSAASIEDMQKSSYWRQVLQNGKELLPLLQARNVDITASSELKIMKLPPWSISLIMKLAINYVPPLKAVLTGHSNPVETKSYCRDVLTSAEVLGISLPRYQAAKALLQVP